MQGLKHKRTIAKFLCFLMILEMFVASPNVAEASVSKTISKNGREYCAVEGNKQTITVTLVSPNKPENTSVVKDSVPGWASVSKPNYNSPVFKVTVQQNNGSGSRVENIKFTDGTNSWTLTLTQYVYKAPTPKPTTKEPTKKPTTKPTQKATPVPTKSPTSTPTPTPELTASEASLGFPADGATKTVTISGYTGTLRADRGNNDTWFTVSVSGGTISVTATKNTSTARASYVDVTDTGSGRSVRIQVTQAAPIINPGPTKAPTSTPTPVPAETLPLKTKTLNFSAQGGQDTLSLDGSGYSLVFSFQDNPSVPSGWVGMVYDGNQIRVKVERNRDYSARSTKIKITDTKTNRYAYVTINQKAAPKPTPTPTPYLTATQTEYPFEEAGGNDTITLKGLHGGVLIDYTWNTEDQKEWAHALYDGQSVRLTVDPNRSIYSRIATIIITDSATKKSVSITVKQKEMNSSVNVPNTLKADKDVLPCEYLEGEQKIKVSGKTGALRVDRVNNEMWFAATVDGNTISVSVKKNTGSRREGYLDITDTGNGQRVRVKISQDVFPLSQDSFSYDCKEDATKAVSVRLGGTLHVEYDWNSIDQKDWVSLTGVQPDDKSSAKYLISVKSNPTYVDRRVIVKISSDNGKVAFIEITQKGQKQPELSSSTTGIIHTLYGSTDSVSLSNVSGTIIVDYENGSTKDASSWIKVVESGKNTYSITTSRNETGERRYAYVVFTDSKTGQTVKVQVWQHTKSIVISFVFEQEASNGKLTEKTIYKASYYGEGYNVPKDPVRDGYTFDGWYTEKALGKGYRVYQGDPFREEQTLTLYGHWLKNKESVVSFKLNYEGCPDYKTTCKANEGKPIGELPTPPERAGYEFVGWFTVPNEYLVKPEHNIQVKKGTVFTGDEMSTLYAHWNATVSFPDFALVGVETYTTKAKEGWRMTIPDEVLKMYNIMGFKVKGWTSNGNSTVAEKDSTRNTYSVPYNLKNSTISLWAVNAEGVTFRQFLLKKYKNLALAEEAYKIAAGIKKDLDTIKRVAEVGSAVDQGMKEWLARVVVAGVELGVTQNIPNAAGAAPDDVVEGVMGKISPPYYASDKAKKDNEELINSKAVQDDIAGQGGYINGQRDGKKSEIRVGETNFGDAGCGIIATYNALHSFGYGTDELEKLIEYFETNGYLMNCPEEIKKFLEDQLKEREKKNIQDKTTEALRSMLKEIEKYGAEKPGGIGANPYAVDDVLAAYGVKTKEYRDYNAFLDDVLAAIQSGEHKKYIVDFWNGTGTATGHFVFFETVACGDKPITAYNYWSTDKGTHPLSFGELKADLIEGSHVRFVVAYEVSK